MRSPTLLAAAVLSAALGAVVYSGVSAPAPAQDRPAGKAEGPAPGKAKAKWEYKVIPQPPTDADTEKALNDLGADGWELAGTTNDVTIRSRADTVQGSTKVRLILRRQQP